MTATLETETGAWLNVVLIGLATAIFTIGMYFPGYKTVKTEELHILQCFGSIIYSLKHRIMKLVGKGDGVKMQHWM